MRNKLRRPLAFLLSAVMIVTMSGTPVHAVADRGQPETGIIKQEQCSCVMIPVSGSSPASPLSCGLQISHT